MKRLLICLLCLCFFAPITAFGEDAPPPAVPHKWKIQPDGSMSTNSPVAIGTPVAAINVAKEVWAVRDSNGDVVASQTVECSDITDGAQDCSIKTYVMIAGTLTLVQTLDTAP
jgi:hypothetical protein